MILILQLLQYQLLDIRIFIFQAMIHLGNTCGMPNLAAEIQDLKTKSLDPFTAEMGNLIGMYIQKP